MNPEMPMDVAVQIPMWVYPVYIVVYVFIAYCLARLAARVGMPMKKSFVMALIPIANIYLIFKMSGKPGWWTALAFVPFVNVVMFIIAGIAYLQKIGKPGWWVVLFFIPLVNLVIFLMLVFGKNEGAVTA